MPGRVHGSSYHLPGVGPDEADALGVAPAEVAARMRGRHIGDSVPPMRRRRADEGTAPGVEPAAVHAWAQP